eukprot:CAMPEP_0172159958 /NCGR_PEP_ID=MMETSP1050-20130122/5280_1 /TAXON_ID=233186 /ORGANISM="Cryptomonas curvata, Strain CCAP979/52" /LENGTH=458 /DNA_ID=CAMNT_0012829645 /DNA_START=1044 /DNA_END=2417 /DNA_ORIENTATION=+
MQFGKQVDFLKNEVMGRSSFGWILGSAGSGKSTAAFAFLTSQLDDKEWIFTWMYFDTAQVLCVGFSNNQKKEFLLEYEDMPALQNYLVEGGDDKRHFLFLDGYVISGQNSKDIRRFTNKCESWLLKNRNMRRLCIICSMSTRGNYKMDEDEGQQVQVHTVSSWILEDYQLAFAQQQVIECYRKNLDAGIKGDCSPDTEQLVVSKFYFAGSCARNMFSYKSAEVINYLQPAIRSCTDIVPYVTYTLGAQSVDRLLSTTVESGYNVQSLVSRFVATEFSLKQGPGMVRRFAQTMCLSSNPDLDGLLFEMWFFALIGHDRLRLAPVWAFGRDRVLQFDPSKNVAIPAFNRVWYKPLKWNQGGYDAVHVDYEARDVTFVQIVISKKHSLKLEYFASLIRNLGIQPNSMEILVLVPRDVVSAFEISSVTGFGLLKDSVNKQNKKWASHKEKSMVKICTFSEDW